jgi:hypothetical protein
MEVSNAEHVTYEERHDSGMVFSDKLSFQSTRPGAIFDMAYFLRNTGPPPTSFRDTVPMAQARRPIRRRNRGLFRKRKGGPEMTSTAAEHDKPSSFIPPEGVEQKITAKGQEARLQILFFF